MLANQFSDMLIEQLFKIINEKEYRVKVIDVTGRLVINRRVRDWCKLPYDGHADGCPNYGKKAKCPPQAPLVQDHFDLNEKHWFIVTEFDLQAHTLKMKELHPDWTDKQCRCVLYWQGTVRKNLSEACIIFEAQKEVFEDQKLIHTLLPEAMGVNVFCTLYKFKIHIRPRPTTIVYKVALVGYPHDHPEVPCQKLLEGYA